MGRIQDAHNELYHYTTAAGLSGMLESKSLRATHTSFVNDEEEILGFYGRVLPEILSPIFQKYIEDIKSTPEFLRLRGTAPHELYCREQFEKLTSTLRKVAQLWHDHYITSFSIASDSAVREHGLLSQWRAYGSDGGYAVVFDTSRLDDVLRKEAVPYQEEGEGYSWVDAQYCLNKDLRTDDPDTNRWIRRLEIAADKYFRLGSSEAASELSEPLTMLSSIFKHPGFAEEKEVRLVLSQLGLGLKDHPEFQSLRQHPVKTRVQGGTTVPFVELCIREVNGVREHLPIKRIIVGPHRDKNDRKLAVQLLLKQYGLSSDVKVSVSDIPYRGR